ncbi:hypothetical protein Droror1_Dr00006007 [Drosera rotundifolia]
MSSPTKNLTLRSSDDADFEVIEYCKKHVEGKGKGEKMTEEELKARDVDLPHHLLGLIQLNRIPSRSIQIKWTRNPLSYLSQTLIIVIVVIFLIIIKNHTAALVTSATTDRNTFSSSKCAPNLYLPNLLSRYLNATAPYWINHRLEAETEDDKEWWRSAARAANYLNIKNLLDLTCQTVADMIKGKTPEEIRKTFNIKNDFTPEEEEEVHRENQWAFE